MTVWNDPNILPSCVFSVWRYLTKPYMQIFKWAAFPRKVRKPVDTFIPFDFDNKHLKTWCFFMHNSLNKTVLSEYFSPYWPWCLVADDFDWIWISNQTSVVQTHSCYRGKKNQRDPSLTPIFQGYFIIQFDLNTFFLAFYGTPHWFAIDSQSVLMRSGKLLQRSYQTILRDSSAGYFLTLICL